MPIRSAFESYVRRNSARQPAVLPRRLNQQRLMQEGTVLRGATRLIVVWLTLAAPAVAQVSAAAQPEPQVVVTTGEGVIRRAPDRAWVTISAESRARTPREAQKINADAMSAVMARLKSSGLQPDAIQTSSYDLQPEFDYANGRQTLRGYVARNSVQVRVDDLPRLGEILDASVGSGATSISSIRFDMRDRTAAEREALRLAVADARARADAAASGAGMRVDRVLRIEEQRSVGVPQPRPMVMAMRAEGAETTTPIAAGELDIRAQVTLTAAIR